MVKQVGTALVRWLGRGLALLALGAAILWVVGPYEVVDTEIAFGPSTMPEDLDGWLADRESQVPNLREGEAKRIFWAGVPGTRTELAIVYIHGFSAGIWETRPVPDRVAEALGANLHFTRLTGHGRDGAALGEPDAGDWLEDVAEAMEVGRRLGDRVVVIATSQGGTLTALLAADPELADLREGLAGVVLISPNFKVANPMAGLLSWPAARHWVDLVAGETRSFEPINQRHGARWTTSYPTRALLPVQALIDRTEEIDWGQAAVPALFYFDPGDQVVDASVTEDVAEAWGASTEVMRVEPLAGDDPFRHVIVGDILSPGATRAAIAAISGWIEGL